MTSVTTGLGEALESILAAFRFFTDSCQCPDLRKVREVRTEGSLDHIVLDFGGMCLLVSANQDDDSIHVERVHSAGKGAQGLDVSSHDPWVSFIGKPFGWGWATVNQQGYCDGVLLSFGGIFPGVLLNVVASSLKAVKI